MAAHQNGQGIGIGAGPPGEHIAHLVNGHCQPSIGAPLLKQMARRAICIGQRLPVIAASNPGANGGHVHQALPQPVAIYGDVLGTGLHGPIGVPLIFDPSGLQGRIFLKRMDR